MGASDRGDPRASGDGGSTGDFVYENARPQGGGRCPLFAFMPFRTDQSLFTFGPRGASGAGQSSRPDVSLQGLAHLGADLLGRGDEIVTGCQRPATHSKQKRHRRNDVRVGRVPTYVPTHASSSVEFGGHVTTDIREPKPCQPRRLKRLDTMPRRGLGLRWPYLLTGAVLEQPQNFGRP